MAEQLGIKERLLEKKKFDASLTPSFPRNIMFELTNSCNHNCIFCPNQKSTRKRGHINDELFKRLLHEAFLLGVTEVGLFITGEPFLSPKLDNYVALAKGIGYKYIYITTNGSLATPERIKSVLDSGLDSIKFSINAGTQDTYIKIHGRNDFQKVINNLKFCSEYIKSNSLKVRVYVSYMYCDENINECNVLENTVRPYIDDIYFLKVDNRSDIMLNSISDSIVKNDQKRLRERPCSIIFNRLHVTCEGYLTICCVDYQNYLVVADLNEVSIKDAWHNQWFTAIRKKHLDDNLEGTLCNNCIYNKMTLIKPLRKEYATTFR